MNEFRRALLERLPRPERGFVLAMLREETVAGALLLAAAVVAMVWANSAWSASYLSLREAVIGPAALHLDLSLRAWAADGLLAIFFFVAGLELKREIVCGQLARPSTALLPVVAAIAGMLVPAGIYLLAAAGPACCWPCMPGSRTAGSPPGGSTCRWPCSSGHWCMPAACTPRSPEWPSGCSPGCDRTRVRRTPRRSGSSTGCDPCQPGWRCPSSRCSQRGRHWPAARWAPR